MLHYSLGASQCHGACALQAFASSLALGRLCGDIQHQLHWFKSTHNLCAAPVITQVCGLFLNFAYSSVAEVLGW